jgi:nitrous oxide reductase accessory protein NosL
VTWGRPARPNGPVVLCVLLSLLAVAACTHSVEGVPTAEPATATPTSATELEALVVTAVPSGLPRLRDDAVDPPAGEKSVEDIAGYSRNPRHERKVLEEYGYRYGWERFWGQGGAGQLTSVFVDQFEHRPGAAAYAADLARNEAGHYGAMLIENPPDLPGGCHLITVEHPDPQSQLSGPAALVWCGHGVFSVSVTVVADSVDAAQEELRAVLAEQLDRLPPG